MAIDKEQQARLTFLAEAETYFGDIETVLLGLKTAADRTSQINIAMRAAHSVKGTAGMMGFVELSQVAHHLEDSFKILRARQLSVDTHLETLLLQGVDCLRTIRQSYQDQQSIDTEWLASDVEMIFVQLNQRLGDLTPTDEARLLSEDNNENLDYIIFTTSVEDCLDEFDQELAQLKGDDLRQAVVDMARRLSEFGLMAQLDPFISLCQSVQRQCTFAQTDQLDAIAHQAIDTWRRSHSLVLLGRTERLPTELKSLHPNSDADNSDLVEFDLPDFSLNPTVALPGVSSDDIDQLQTHLADLGNLGDLPQELIVDDLASLENSLDESLDLVDVQEKLSAIPAETLPVIPTETPVENLVEPSPETLSVVDPVAITSTDIELETVTAAQTEIEPTAAPAMPDTISEVPVDIPLVPLRMPPSVTTPKTQKDSTVRVSVDQLKQINSTFESLILDRNAVNLKLDQLQAFSTLMQERMVALTSFNKGLRQWYDQASTEGAMAAVGTHEAAVGTHEPGQKDFQVAQVTAAPEELDVLEFDRYSKLHSLAQENMETIVKLEEVSRDIELGLSEIGQSINSLNYTSRTLKTRITQTQMRPFETIVGRFPRVVRDWSVQYGKPVELKLEGTPTLIEQFALDQLSDPLTHLLRNAFDHGIESPEIRQAQQKPVTGTIMLRAVNRGNRVVITLSDDGGGINLDKVRDRIRKYALPAEQIDNMGQQELLSFIFEPGFSTSGQVTELSGRGFGMDVVNTNLKELQGDIQVATDPGQGTTFTITIPLSLSILRVMLLERSGSVFALPVDMVQEVIRTPEVDLTKPSMTWKNETISLVRLEDHWTVQSATRPLALEGQPLINCPMVVVVGEGQNSYGLTIDRFWQEQEVAIRSVASPIPLPPGFGGVTVLGDGRVVPLLEPIRLMEWIMAGPELAPAKPASTPISAHTKAASILVVDDSIHARRYLATTLERSGYLVEQAKDGREAVDKVLAGLAIEAIICDIEMPRLDGYGVLEELRNEPEFTKLPIFMLTSRSSEKHRKLAMNLGATAYFSKPYNEQELLQQLQQLTKGLKTV